MKKFKSPTANGGTTIVLDSVQDAIKVGLARAETRVSEAGAHDPNQKVTAIYIKRDDLEGKEKKKQVTWGALHKAAIQQREWFNECTEAIVKGCESDKDEINRLVEELRDLALDMAPSLRANHAGFDRSDNGITASPELLAAGEEMCCFKRKDTGDAVKPGAGEGAYRIIINTDVCWCGQPNDSAAVLGALIILLQQFKPVEVWIQQGWMGDQPEDGITLDFTGAFDPTALAFWIGHKYKDGVFSWLVNMGLGRHSSATSTRAEIPADLYLRGDWMKAIGINDTTFPKLLHTERMDLMAEWVSKTAMQLAFGPAGGGPTIELN